MTVVVAFLCLDGVVIGADSMLTATMDNRPIAQHTGKKISVLSGQQVFAYAGDQGQGARFCIMVDGNHNLIAGSQHPIDYPITIARSMISQFQATGIGNSIGVNTVLGYEHKNIHQCCVFEGPIQPRLLDQHHYYVSLGSGKLSADPFLRFLVDIFCQAGQPNVREAVFLATWTIEHVIHTTPGGVAGPTRVAVLERAGAGFSARELPDIEIHEHRQAMESAGHALRAWRDGIQSGDAAAGVPPPPLKP